MIVLDASVLIAFLDPADAHHGAAVELISVNRGPFTVHALTLAEALVGPARVGREQEVFADLASIGVGVADLGADEPVLLARTRASHALRMPDACVLTTAVHLAAPLATFDARLARAAREAGRVVLPQR